MSAVLFLSGSAAHAVMDSRFELDSKVLDRLSVPAKPSAKAKKKPIRHSAAKSISRQAKGNTYTVKSGDNLFRILMRDYSLSNDEAEALIEEVRRENNIYDIRRLKVGQKINIPPVSRKQTLPAAAAESGGKAFAAGGLHLELPAASSSSGQDNLLRVRDAWGKLVPSGDKVMPPVSLESTTFALTLDPQHYPVFPAHDGGRIIVDRSGTIPPLVKSLIMAKDPNVRIVSESPADAKRFLAAMIQAAGFYSVEENFTMDFGADPKLQVFSDFKIEKTADSLIRQDILLMNSSRSPLPAPLAGFLKREGFTVNEPFVSSRPLETVVPMRHVFQVTAKKQSDQIDTVLESLSVPFQVDRRVDVFPGTGSGIALSVKVDRSFEKDGHRFVVTSFDGDPVNYTLFRIMETTGYRVVILENRDDFRRISEKILSAMKIPADYAFHKMSPEGGSHYTLQISGFRLDSAAAPGSSIFLTDLVLDPIIKELLKDNGYAVHVK